VSCEEVLHRSDCRRGRFFHQPVAGVRHDDFLHVRRRVAHHDRHVGAEGLLRADETDMTVDHIEAIKALIPLKRAGDPGEIAGLVAYLARKESGYMTGSSLTIDGGMAL
jgi:NAD(P)-dependent dehydrogenase (short-subunit alcohol dehydrogenase family)